MAVFTVSFVVQVLVDFESEQQFVVESKTGAKFKGKGKKQTKKNGYREPADAVDKYEETTNTEGLHGDKLAVPRGHQVQNSFIGTF